MPEYTPEQIAELQKWANLGQALVSDKRTKVEAEKLVKQLNPDIETSEDLAAPLLAPMRAKIEALEAQLGGINNSAAEWRKQQQIEGLRKAGYTDEGITKIEEIMTSKSLNDVEVAAAYFDKTNPAPAPRLPGMSSATFGNDIFGLQDTTQETLDLLFNDPDAFIAQEANKVADEFRNQ